MTRTITTKALLAFVVVAAATGTVDAALEGAWDHFAIFAVTLVAALSLALEYSARRSMVSLRHDLVRSLTERAELTGEPVEQIADRAVAWYVSAMGVDAGGSRQ